MLPSELSSNVTLLAASAIIIISYAVLLIKLRPSIKEEKPALATKDQVSLKPQESPKESAKKAEGKNSVQPKAHIEKEEKQNPKIDDDAKKSFFLFGESNFEGCSHKFGYLSSLPKNTPLPDECFGCPQIIECLRS